jgi:hypothetical protein
MNQKQVVASLLEKANKYREFARWISDRETVHQILALAGELKQRALALAKPDENALAKCGKKTAGQSEEMLSSGFRPNESLGKPKNSQ